MYVVRWQRAVERRHSRSGSAPHSWTHLLEAVTLLANLNLHLRLDSPHVALAVLKSRVGRVGRVSVRAWRARAHERQRQRQRGGGRSSGHWTVMERGGRLRQSILCAAAVVAWVFGPRGGGARYLVHRRAEASARRRGVSAAERELLVEVRVKAIVCVARGHRHAGAGRGGGESGGAPMGAAAADTKRQKVAVFVVGGWRNETYPRSSTSVT